MGDFVSWIGREDIVTDVAVADRVADLMALLDDPGPMPATLPLLGHWLLFRQWVPQSALGPDGHPLRGEQSLLPPVEQPRRMWAASDVHFLGEIPLDAVVTRRTTVADIAQKDGRSGAMTFVTLDHQVLHDGAIAIRERQQIVYRAAPSQPYIAPQASPVPAARYARRYIADPMALFRYSALTGNTHRIHYDREYAREEGYPALVVQGPFAATLLLDHYRRTNPDTPVLRYAFRARAPLFDCEAFDLSVAERNLWIVDARGAVTMTAEVSG